MPILGYWLSNCLTVGLDFYPQRAAAVERVLSDQYLIPKRKWAFSLSGVSRLAPRRSGRQDVSVSVNGYPGNRGASGALGDMVRWGGKVGPQGRVVLRAWITLRGSRYYGPSTGHIPSLPSGGAKKSSRWVRNVGVASTPRIRPAPNIVVLRGSRR